MSARLTAQLAALSGELPDRDRAVLRFVTAHRFATGGQLGRVFFAEHRTLETGARVGRKVLARLVRLDVLARLERRVGGVRAGANSYVYRVGELGRGLLAIETGEGLGRRVSEPSAWFLSHTLAVTEAHVLLVEAERAKRLSLTSFVREPACWRQYLNIGGGREVLKPDAWIVTRSGEFEDVWFLEVDQGTESIPRVIRKCRQYETYRRTDKEQATQGIFGLVVWAVPNEQRASKITDRLATTGGLDPRLFRVITTEQLPALLGADNTTNPKGGAP